MVLRPNEKRCIDKKVSYLFKRFYAKLSSLFKSHLTKEVYSEPSQTSKMEIFGKTVKAAATDMRYFARSKFSRSLVHKKKISLIRQVFFKLRYVFRQER